MLMDVHPALPLSPDEQRLAAPSRRSRIRLITRFALAVCVVLAIGIDATGFFWELAAGSALIRSDDVQESSRWPETLAAASLIEAGKGAVLGMLSAWLVCRVGAHRKSRFFSRQLIALAVGIGLAGIVTAARHSQRPGLFDLILPVGGTAFGVWVGFHCLRGWRSVVWLVPKIAVLLVLLAGFLATGLWLATSDTPLALRVPSLSATETNRVLLAFDMSESLDGGLRYLRLSERDVNLLVAAGLARLPADGKADVTFGEGLVAVDFSLAIPRWPPFGRYINGRGVCRLAVEEGRPLLRLVHLQVGRLTAPRALLSQLQSAIVSAIRADPKLRQSLASIHSVRFFIGGMEEVHEADDFDRTLAPTVATFLGESPRPVNATNTAHCLMAASRRSGFSDPSKQTWALSRRDPPAQAR